MAQLPSKAILCLFFLLCPMKFAVATNSAKESLTNSAALFDKGQYKKALEKIRDIDIRSNFDSSDDMKLAFKIRAIAYEQTGDIVRACETIRELFFLDPDYKFSPFDTPTTVVALAQKEKASFDAKNKQMASIKNEAHTDEKNKQHPANSASISNQKIYIEKKPHFITTLFPMGLNHFYLSSPLKGGIYLSLQMLGLTTNIAAFWWKQSYLESFGSTHLKNSQYQGRFETAQMIQYVALGAMIASYCASVIDALIRFHGNDFEAFKTNS